MNVMIKDENPLIAIRGDIDLSEVEYPAITICSEQTTKYAFAERLGNYIDPDLELPHPLKKLQKKFFDELLMNQYGELLKKDINTYLGLQKIEFLDESKSKILKYVVEK